jgi:hypothetical protein
MYDVKNAAAAPAPTPAPTPTPAKTPTGKTAKAAAATSAAASAAAAKAIPPGERLAYCQKGVGGENGCLVQVIADVAAAFGAASDAELPINALKLTWSSLSTLTQGLEYVGKARALQVPILLATSNDAAAAGGSRSSVHDAIDVDFAVGVGALQYHTGGIYDAGVCHRLNHLVDLSREHPTIPYAGGKFRLVE